MFHEYLASSLTNGARRFLDLGFHKNAELEYPLEFFGPAKPSVIAASRMGSEIIVCSVLAAHATRRNVIRLPFVACDLSAENMAQDASFIYNIAAAISLLWFYIRPKIFVSCLYFIR